MCQLLLFRFSSGERIKTEGRGPPDLLGFFALRLTPAGASRAAWRRPDLPSVSLQSAFRLRFRRALSSAGAGREYHPD